MSEEPSENISLAAFRNSRKTSFSRNPTFSSKRRVSMTRICERLARASNPSTKPMGTRNGCSRSDVVSGITKQASGPNPLIITHGRTYHSPFPSCSVPIFTPSRHHHISRTVYKRGRSSCVCFFILFHPSKSFSIIFYSVHFQTLYTTYFPLYTIYLPHILYTFPYILCNFVTQASRRSSCPHHATR
jgi:hypothetical protein